MRRLAMLAVLLPGILEAQTARGQVLQAWRQRQLAIDSAHFVWAEQQAHRRDWLPNPRHPEPDRVRDPEIRFERMDSIFRTLVITGNQMRFSYVARRLTPDGARPIFDTVRLDWRAPSPVPQELWLRPILMAIRPLDRHLGMTGLGRGRVNPWYDPMYRGPPVLNFEEPVGRDGWKWSFWVDPARDYIIKRYRLPALPLGDQPPPVSPAIIVALRRRRTPDLPYQRDPRNGAGSRCAPRRGVSIRGCVVRSA
jgi:hypothetical protein